MLPKNLLHTYQQYKTDTDTIAGWLATTAKRLGYVSESVSETKPKTARLKGKARKTAKDTSTQGRPTYTIQIKDFTALAGYIAEYKTPPVQVPPKLAALLDRTIATREWFSNEINPDLTEDQDKLQSDDRHSYFLGTLKSVRDILGPRYSKDHKTCKKSPKTTNDIVNLFENLELEEPSKAFEDAPDMVPTPPLVQDTDANYVAEVLNDIGEAFVTLHLLLADLHKLRAEVKAAWEGYKLGLVDLVAASITTNTAVDLARAMEDDLKDLFGKYGGTQRMIEIFYAAQCMAAGYPELYCERPDDDFNFHLYHLADQIYKPCFTILTAFSKLVQPNYLPEYKPNFYGTYDPKSNRSKKPNRDKYLEDKTLLLQLLPEFVVLCKGTERAPAEDEFTRGIRIMCDTKKVCLWLAFASTLFLDVHHTLRDQVDVGFSQLSGTAEYVRTTIKNTLDFHDGVVFENWPEQNNQFLRVFSDEIKHWVEDDPHRGAARQLGRKKLPEPNFFFRQHPWSCGLWKYFIQVQFQDLSITLANAWGSIMFCGHLYNALLQEKLLTKKWEDMMLCLMVQGHGNFFTGDPPRSPEQYLKHFGLALGASLASMTGRSRKGALTRSKRGPHSLKEKAAVLRTFRERYCERTPRFDLRAEDVESIIEHSNWEIELNEEDQAATLSKVSDPEPGEKKAALKKVTVAKMLGILRATMHAEMIELSFDYMLLHRFCWRLLRGLKEKFGDRLVQSYGNDYIEKEPQLPFIVGYIFMTATSTARFGGILKAKKKTAVVTSRLLTDAAEVVEGMIDAGAGKIVGTAMDRDFGVKYEVQEEED
ncbi:hypothetical protein EJ04DRAFT_513260 [Polyplosphaeria fusca]|uniref:DUF6604 domain-containing protein n=1 Tax=Polyplosphaeria fusca TaxID=682080 RepID=A0A9P4QYT7_9PLEO|nr:hypothetical protein EJ04DRAFT_513260 [Polyplosphaeria fusca]